MTALLQLRDIALSYGKSVAVAGLNLRIEAGERIALVGANGCGKSSLLRLLHRLIQPSSGSLQGRSGLACAMLFQRPHMLRASALNNLALGLWLQGQSWSQARAQSLSSLREVGLAERAQRNARTLSGGQQQRLALARAFAMQPELLLLDEPTASLDPQARRDVEALISTWSSTGATAQGPLGETAAHTAARTAGPHPGGLRTLVFASHNLGQVKRLAQRVIYLEHGRICADLPVQQFFDADRMQREYPQAHMFLNGELA